VVCAIIKSESASSLFELIENVDEEVQERL
jgi:hypothetical protein